jgi:hypothetical protein
MKRHLEGVAMEDLHDWHVTTYMLAVHRRIDLTRIRNIDGVVTVDNDPAKEALLDRMKHDQREQWTGIARKFGEIYVERCEVVDSKLQAALSPPRPPRIESTQSMADIAAPKPNYLTAGDWVNRARVRALEIVKEQGARDLYPSQEDMSETIAEEFRKHGVFGVEGKPLTGATIKRHALKGISSAVGKQRSTTRR